MIEVASVSKRFGTISALRNVSFQVEKGEIVGLLGRNGAGKTTMLRILACFFPPSEGQVSIAGLNLATDSLAARRKIGYFLEKTPVYREMRVAEFLEFAAKLKGVARTVRKNGLAEVMDVCGLDGVRRRMIGNLSRGYHTRIGLAQALLGEPEVLLLDEPTVGLDPEQIIEIRDLIKGLAGRKTIILSTHILSEVSQLCSKIIILDRGAIVADDSQQTLKAFLQQGNAAFTALIDAPAGQVVEELQKTPGIVRVQLEQTVSPTVAHYLIEVAASDFDFPAVLCGLAFRNRWILREFQPAKMNLEEMFVELIGKETLRQ